MSKKNLLTILQYIIFLGLGIGLIYWQAGNLNAEQKLEIRQAIEKVGEKIWLIIPIIVIGFLSHLFRALRWKILLEPLSLKPTTINITCAVMVGYIVNLLLPRMGEVARCTVLAKYEHEPADKIIGTIVAERSFDLLCLVIVAVLTFLLQIDVVGGYTKELLQKFSQKGSAVLIVLTALLLLIALLIFIHKKSKNSKIGHFIEGIGDGIRSILLMKKRWMFILYTMLIWGCYLSLIYIGFKAIPATAHLGIAAALAVLVFGSLAMIITPGGLGAYPPAVQIVLIKLYAINSVMALAFGWVSWLAQTGIIVVFGLLSLLILPAYNRTPHGQVSMD